MHGRVALRNADHNISEAKLRTRLLVWLNFYELWIGLLARVGHARRSRYPLDVWTSRPLFCPKWKGGEMEEESERKGSGETSEG